MFECESPKSAGCLGASVARPVQCSAPMRLHRWFSLALVVPLSAGCGDSDSSTCESKVSKRLEVSPADAPLKFHLDRCRVDVDACAELCQVALSRIHLALTVNSCTVGFVGENALLDVEYTVFRSDNNNCFREEFPNDSFGGGGPK
jgi:hypothetical protein